MRKKPDKLVYFLITTVSLILIFFLGNAQQNNGSLLEFGPDLINGLIKTFSSVGNLIVVTVMSSRLVYRSHKIFSQRDTQSLGVHAWAIIYAASVVTGITFLINSNILSGHVEGLGLLAISSTFISSLLWFIVLETVANIIFKYYHSRG